MAESTVQIILEAVVSGAVSAIEGATNSIKGSLDTIQSASSSMTSNAGKAFSGLISSAQDMAGGIISAVGNIGTALGAVSATIGMFGIKEAANFQKLRIQLQAITRDTEEVDSIMGMLAKRATELPIDLPSAQQGLLLLRGLGVEGDRLTQIFRALTSEVGVFGNVQNLSERVTIAFAQTLASQNMQAQEMRQFMNAFIPGYHILAEGIKEGTIQAKGLTATLAKQGTTVGVTTKQVAAAKDTIKEANDHLAIQQQRYKELIATHAKTTNTTEKYTTGVADLDYKIAKLNNTIKENQEWLKNAAGKNNVSTESVMKHNDAISEAQAQISILNSKLVNHTRTIKSVTQVNNASASSLMTLNEQMDDNREKIAKAQRVIESFTGTVGLSTYSVDDLASALRGGLGEAKINSIQAIDAIAKWMIDTFEPAMVAATNSFSGQVQIMKNNLKMLGSELVGVDVLGRETNGVFTIISDTLKGLNYIVLDARKFLQSFNGEGKAGIPIWIQLGAAFLGLMSIGPFLGMISPALGRFGTLGSVILIVAGAIGLMKQHWAEIEPYWDRLKEKLEILKPIWDDIKGKIENFVSSADEQLKTLPDKISKVKDLVESKIQELKNLFVFGEVDPPKFATWSDVLEKAKKDVKDVREKVEKEIDIWKKKLDTFVEEIKPTLGSIWDDFTKSWEKAKLGFKEIKENLDGLKPFITTLAILIGLSLIPIILSLGSSFLIITGIIRGLINSFGDLTLVMGDVLRGQKAFWSAVGNLAHGNFEQAKKDLVDYGNAVTSQQKHTVDATKNFVIGFTENAKDIYSVVEAAVKALSIGKQSSFGDLLKQQPGKQSSFGDLLKQQHGGIIPGPIGAPIPIMAHGGEMVTPSTGVINGGNQGGGGGITINMTGSISMDSEERVRQLAYQIVRILGRQSELARYGTGY